MVILWVVLAVTCIVSYQAFYRPEIQARLEFNAWQINKQHQYHRLFSHAFVHANWFHLIINMLVLYSFGRGLIMRNFLGNGPLMFLFLYLSAIPVASLFSLRKHKDNPYYNAVGASGAVSAVVFSYIFMEPWSLFYLMGLIPVPGIVFGIGYLIYSYRMSQVGSDHIGHDAHFWGAVYGLVFPALISPRTIEIFFSKLVAFF